MSVKPYLYIVLFFFLILSISARSSEKLRSLTVAAVAPLAHGKSRPSKAITPQAYEQVKIEYDLLSAQLESLQEWILFEGKKESGKEMLTELETLSNSGSNEAFYQRRSQELMERLEREKRAVLAKVIFREPISWTSSLWLNVGKKENRKLGKEVVAVNSPVVHGNSLVGVVEQVEESKCRIRLITDSSLVPSVRAVRGKEQYRWLQQQLEALITSIQLIKAGQGSGKELQQLTHLAEQLKKSWQSISSDAYLAKGELHGASAPLWHSRGMMLKGIGFNYDFFDEEGPARELRSGEALDRSSGPIPLLRVGDLLITTGFDGVFPAGLKVALVKEVGCLKEGASSYELTAYPTAGNLSHLENLFILPPCEAP
jgi:cell shape-determining protein MreC